ncbi:MAG: class B sortase [Lachnospiraceae bacterium]
MKKKINTIAIIICAIVFCISGYQLWSYFSEGKQHQEEFKELTKVVEQTEEGEDSEEKKPDYEALHKQNSDMAGWISIEDMDINYPVMYTPESPNFYLKRNFDKEESNYGVPYISEACDIETPSDNIIIYGHHIKGRKMFGELMNYEEESFYKEHKIINFDTLKEEGKYEVFAVFKTTAYEGEGFAYYEFIDAKDESEFKDFVKQCKSLALYETGITPEYGDKLLTLSTCEYSQEEGRFVVVAKCIK